MTINKWFFTLILLATSHYCFSETLTDYRLRKDDGKIQIYTKDENNSSFLRFLGVTTVKASVNDLVNLLHDVPSANQWIDAITYSERLTSTPTTAEYIGYLHSDTPWPAKKRDTVIWNKVTQDETTGVVTIQMKALPDYIPEKKDRVRVQRYDGYWQFTPIDELTTKVQFSALCDPGGSMPSFAYNTAVTESPYKTLKNLQKGLPFKSNHPEFKPIKPLSVTDIQTNKSL